MPRIPQYNAERGIPGGPIGTEMDPNAAMLPARAAGQMGQQIAQSSGQVGNALINVADIKLERKQREGAEWAQSKENLFRRESDRFLVDNQNDTDLAEKYEKWAQSFHDSTSGAAPTSQAAKDYKSRHNQVYTSKWSEALKAGDINSQAKFASTINEAAQIAVAGSNFNTSSPLDTFASTQRTLDLIETQKSPIIRQRLTNAYVEEVVIGVSLSDPHLARKILDSRTNIDPVLRAKLSRTLDGAEKSLDAFARGAYMDSLTDTLAKAQKFGNWTPLPVPDRKAVEANLGSSVQAYEIIKAYETHNKVSEAYQAIKSLASPLMAFEAGKTFEKTESDDVNSGLAKLVAEKQKQQKEATVDWLNENNENIANLNTLRLTSTDPMEREQYSKAYHRSVLDQQGHPPKGMKPEDPAYGTYLFREPPQLNVLSPAQATDWSKKFENTPADKFNELYQDLATEIPDDDARAVAWADMVSMGKMDPMIQMVSMIPDKENRKQFLDVFRNSKDIIASSSIPIDKFEALVKAAPSWVAFKSLDPNLGPQRQPMINTLERAIATTSARLLAMSNGAKSEEAAVEEAVSMLIDKSWGGFTMNGQKVLVQKMRDDLDRKPARTNEEIEATGRAASYAMLEFPVHMINLNNPENGRMFPKLSEKGTEMDKLKYVQDAVRKNARLFTNANGQGAQVWLYDETAQRHFPIKDKNGKNFELDYDELSALPVPTRMKSVGSYGPGGGFTMQNVSEVVQPPPLVTEDKGSFWKEWINAMEDSGPLGVFYPAAVPFMEGKKTVNLPPIRSYWKNLSK